MRLCHSNLSLLGLLGFAALSPLHVQAQVIAVPFQMNFQGRLATPSGNPVPDGTYSIRFSLWDAATAGTEKWNQTLANVTVKNGTFAAALSGFPATTFDRNLWLETKIGTDTPHAPRQQIMSVPYAFKSNFALSSNLALTVPDASISNAKLAGGITADKFAANIFNPLTWLLGGNSGTNPANQFLGTTDNQPLVFRTNNLERMRLDSAGNLGIGTLTPVALLDIRGGENPLGTPAFIVGGSNGTQGQRAIAGLYSTFMNVPADTNARRTADIVAGFNGGVWGTEYLTFNVGNNGAANDAAGLTSEKLRITASGNVGIGTSTPTAKLHVNGGININGVNVLELGAGVANKDGNAGKFGYQLFTADALDIVGAGIGPLVRKIKFWAEGGAAFTGAVTAAGGTFSGPLSATSVTASSATIPTLNGNVSINGEVTAQVVTITGGSDVAEPYEVANAGEVKPLPGYVVAIDTAHVGQMRVSSRAYDKTVAGILSGANGIAPGITLRQKGTVADGTHPVASIGRVWCWCDADANGAIEAGDMLTTSNTAGHAMRVDDYSKANGSVIGKAMSSLKSGKGLVLVLVSLK